MLSAPTEVKIAIVGGGICGLALAAGLCKIPHLDVHVYEAVSEYKGTDARLELQGPPVQPMYVTSVLNTSRPQRHRRRRRSSLAP